MKGDKYLEMHQIAENAARQQYRYSTGTILQENRAFSVNFDEEQFWNMMYIKPKPVIVVCAFCKSHNAISNPTCVQCGAPMGYGKER